MASGSGNENSGKGGAKVVRWGVFGLTNTLGFDNTLTGGPSTFTQNGTDMDSFDNFGSAATDGDTRPGGPGKYPRSIHRVLIDHAKEFNNVDYLNQRYDVISLYIVANPTSTLTANMVANLKKFVENGGVLLITSLGTFNPTTYGPNLQALTGISLTGVVGVSSGVNNVTTTALMTGDFGATAEKVFNYGSSVSYTKVPKGVLPENAELYATRNEGADAAIFAAGFDNRVIFMDAARPIWNQDYTRPTVPASDVTNANLVKNVIELAIKKVKIKEEKTP